MKSLLSVFDIAGNSKIPSQIANLFVYFTYAYLIFAASFSEIFVNGLGILNKYLLT